MLHFLNAKRPDILIIADTRLSKDIETVVKAEWGGHAHFSSFTSQARGVAIFMRKDFPVKVLDSFKDKEGNILSLLLEIETKKVLVQGTYGPSKDNPSFYSEECFKKLEIWDPNFAIFVGDWNIALDYSKDTLNYNGYNNPRVRVELQNKIAEFDLIDIWRELHPTEKKFT